MIVYEAGSLEDSSKLGLGAIEAADAVFVTAHQAKNEGLWIHVTVGLFF